MPAKLKNLMKMMVAARKLVNNPLDLLVIAPLESRRVRALQNSLLERNLPPARVLPWLEVMAGVPLEEHIRPNTLLKLDSPSEDWATDRALLELGYTLPEPERHGGYARVNPQNLEYQLGAILASRQWYLGFQHVLQNLKGQLEGLGRSAMNHPDDIATMFDKRATHTRLEAAGIRVPPALPPVHNFDELFEQMQTHGWSRVFVKLAHGSGAAGVIALETHQGKWQATSTVEMVGNTTLFNTKRLWKYRSLEQIVDLVNAVCQQRVHVEKWLPKASFEDRIFDLRVVVIAGQAKHVLVRASRGTITNLHLGNERGNWQGVREKLADVWLEIEKTCQQTMTLFPKSLYSGVDVLVHSNWKQHAVLEMNAFGDYHRNVLVNGLDTYQTQLEEYVETQGK
jgi:glutathione synthase/RimK-type ligase-like ATP-grasp enzyme